MAEIIEKGTKIHECDRCGCKFTLEAKDIKHKEEFMSALQIYFYGAGYFDYDYCNCPQCGEKIRLN